MGLVSHSEFQTAEIHARLLTEICNEFSLFRCRGSSENLSGERSIQSCFNPIEGLLITEEDSHIGADFFISQQFKLPP